MTAILGLDIGTTSTIGILIDVRNRTSIVASRPVTLTSSSAGAAEQDPEQWWSNVCAIMRELLHRAGIRAETVAAVGVTGMLPAVVTLDADDRVLRPSIQQSDARCAAEVEALRREVDETAFTLRTGNGVNQQLVAAKLRWLQNNEPQAFSRLATVFGSYDFINWRLTGRKAIEANWALEAGFVDLGSHEVMDDLVALSHVPRRAVPPKSSANSILGGVSDAAALATGLAAGTPVITGGADHIASALGAGLIGPGDAVLKFGGCIDVMVATAKLAPDPRMYLDYHLVPGLYIANGCTATGGTGLNWFAANFAGAAAVEAVAMGLTVHQRLDQHAALIPAGSDGVAVLPYFLGEKTPVHDPSARGLVTGLSLAHGVGHVWRALLEAYGYAVAHHLEVLREMGHEPRRYIVTDGGSASAVWMQIVADILQAPLHRLRGHPGSSLGIAWVAAQTIGAVDDWGVAEAFGGQVDVIAPNPAHGPVYTAGYRNYRDLYRPSTA